MYCATPRVAPCAPYQETWPASSTNRRYNCPDCRSEGEDGSDRKDGNDKQDKGESKGRESGLAKRRPLAASSGIYR